MRDSAYELEEMQALPPIGGGSVFDSLEYTKPAVRLPLTLIEAYRDTIARRGYVQDESQYAAVQRMQHTYEQWVAFKTLYDSTFKKLVIRPTLPRGIYLWGGVGTGKSLLMDLFYLTVRLNRKRRVHFHHFMRDVHREMDTLKGQSDPLEEVSIRIAKRYRLICFDEFHVNDIADAMILGRLLEGTMSRGVVYCMTSNYHPEELYANGLQRERFLPTIALIKERLDIVHVDSGIDYRRRTMEQLQVYHTPINADTDAALLATFKRVAEAEEENQPLDVEGRVIPYVRRAGSVVWFKFDALCGGPRSQLDYLDLAKRFHTIIVSHVPRMTEDDVDKARRFTLLVDVLYESKVKLIVSAEVPANALYVKGPLSHEFARTVSRLHEMESAEYLAEQRSTAVFDAKTEIASQPV
ncbi:MAG TPA: cell division protein ZapE [Burkholderiales bacterium]|nr:cell division protein ZapE [Burkholderiales bacterium]